MTGTTGGPGADAGSGTEPGPLAEEAARLVDAVGAWLRNVLAGADPGSERIATGAAECQVCPVCRMLAVLRGDHPEAVERLATVTTETATTLAGILRTVFDGCRCGTGTEPPGEDAEPSRAGTTGPVETIHIS